MVAKGGSTVIIIWFFILSTVKEGTGYETRQTSKEQTKMPRFMLEGARRAQSFVLRPYTMHELRIQHIAIG